MIGIVADLLLYIAAFGFLVFTLGFGLLVEWRSTAMGRHVMAFMTALGMIVAYAALRRAGVIPAGNEDLARAMVWGTVSAIVWWRVILFKRIRFGKGGTLKIFGREPTLLLQMLQALLALFVSFQLAGLTADQAGAILAVGSAVLGVINALAVRPIAPAAFTTLVTTVTALMTTYGLNLSQQQIGAIQFVVIAGMAFLTRQQVTPAASPRPLARE